MGFHQISKHVKIGWLHRSLPNLSEPSQLLDEPLNINEKAHDEQEFRPSSQVKTNDHSLCNSVLGPLYTRSRGQGPRKILRSYWLRASGPSEDQESRPTINWVF